MKNKKQSVRLLQCVSYIDREGAEGGEHIVPVDETEEALRGAHDRAELDVVGTENQPASKYKPDKINS